jgi:hypothetical protein
MKKAQKLVLELDYILTGSVIKKHGPCGKESCRCARGEKYWHGPYFIWTRKEKGKTVTKSLSPEQAQLCREAIGNMLNLKVKIEKWRKKSMEAIEKHPAHVKKSVVFVGNR